MAHLDHGARKNINMTCFITDNFGDRRHAQRVLLLLRSELRLGSAIENEHQTGAKFLTVKTVITRREAAAKLKLMALNNEDLQPPWLEIGNPF